METPNRPTTPDICLESENDLKSTDNTLAVRRKIGIWCSIPTSRIELSFPLGTSSAIVFKQIDSSVRSNLESSQVTTPLRNPFPICDTAPHRLSPALLGPAPKPDVPPIQKPIPAGEYCPQVPSPLPQSVPYQTTFTHHSFIHHQVTQPPWALAISQEPMFQWDSSSHPAWLYQKFASMKAYYHERISYLSPVPSSTSTAYWGPALHPIFSPPVHRALTDIPVFPGDPLFVDKLSNELFLRNQSLEVQQERRRARRQQARLRRQKKSA